MMDSLNNKKIISGFAWKFAERFLAQGVSFIVSVVLARLLMPSDYGLIAMVLIFISFADCFVSSGFATSLIQNKNSNEVDFSTMFHCSLIVSFFVYVLLFFLSPMIAEFYNEPILSPLLRVFALKLPLSVYNTIQHAYVSRHMLFRRFFFSTLIGTVLSGIVGILLAYMGFGVWALVAQYFTNTIIDTIVLAITVKWYPHMLFSWSSAKKLMSYGTKILIADLSGTFFGQLRSFIIGKSYTTADLAYYNKGQQFSTLISGNIGQSIMTVLFPAMSNEGEDIERVKQMSKKSIQLVTYMLFPLLFGIASVARSLVLLLYTNKWIECVPFVRLLSISSAIGLLSVISLQTIKAIGRSDVVLKLEIIKKPVYIILLIIGVSKGLIAIAVTMVIYEIYGALVNMFQLKKYANYGMKEQLFDLFPAMFLSIFMSLLVFCLPFSFEHLVVELCIKILCGLFIYLLGSYIISPPAFRYLLGLIKTKVKRC